MKLDIIVPHYKEPWETCKYLFDSIAMQRMIPFEDIRVIFVNDGEDVVFDEKIFGMYPYSVEYIVKEHEGVSAARNCGLDISNADYVMFCDCDDGFINNYGLHLVFSAMQEGFDFLYSNFIEETYTDTGVRTIIPHDLDLTFMHGKVYNRQFMSDKNLRFDPAMTIHEDGYFNMIVYVTAKNDGKIKTVNTPFYAWCWNDESVVRSNKKDFVLKTYDDVMLTRTGICDELKRRGYMEEYEDSVCMTVMNSYYDFQKDSYHTTENRRYLKDAEKAFKGFYQKFGKTFLHCPDAKVAEIAKAARENACRNGMLMEQQDLKSFLRHIEYEVKT